MKHFKTSCITTVLTFLIVTFVYFWFFKISKEERTDNINTLVLYYILLDKYKQLGSISCTTNCFPIKPHTRLNRKADRYLYRLKKVADDLDTNILKRATNTFDETYPSIQTPDIVGMITRIQPYLNKLPILMDIKRGLKTEEKSENVVDNFINNLSDFFQRKSWLSPNFNAIHTSRPFEIKDDIDDREDFNKIEPILVTHFGDEGIQTAGYQAMKNNWESVVLVVDSIPFKKSDDTFVLVNATKLKNSKRFKFCSTEEKKYQEEMIVQNARGSGFFININKIVTAAHVVHKLDSSLPFDSLRFIVGFDSKTEFNDTAIIVHKGNIFKPIDTTLNEGEYWHTTNGPDWAIFEVKPEYPDYVDKSKPHAYISTLDTNIQLHKHVYNIGHGLGLPKKLYFDSPVTEAYSNKDYFQCRLDFSSGNSGSPVFYANTHAGIGIAIRGEDNLIKNGSKDCYRKAIYYYNDHARGEHVQRFVKKITDAASSISSRSASAGSVMSTTGRPKVINHRPYVYLNKIGNTYTIYTMIKLYDRTKIVKLIGENSSQGSYYYKYEIRNSELGNTIPSEYVTLCQCFINDTINPENWEVQIQVQLKGYEPDSIFTSTLSLDHADDQSGLPDCNSNNQFETECKGAKTAWNSPYAYLNDPQGDGVNIDFPYIIIPSKGMINDPTEQEYLTGTSAYNCISKIYLKSEPDSTSEAIYLQYMVNNHQYIGVDDQEFLVELHISEPGFADKIRKVRTKNIHADRKPIK